MTGLALAQEAAAAWPAAVDAPGPASFAERGVAVAFTTPALAASRLRRDGRGYPEVVMPNIVDGRGVYVIPWGALSEIMAVTIHDRMLHREIVWHATIEPENIRLSQLRIAARGFSGADAAVAAQRALGADERVAAGVNLALIVELIHAGGVSSAAAFSAAQHGSADTEFRRALHGVAGRIGIPALMLADRLTQLGARLGAVGLSPARPAGRLRRLVHAVEGFATTLALWRRGSEGADAEIAELCGAVAAATALRCHALLDALDARLADPIALVRAWPRDARTIDDTRAHLAWLLDGWKRIIVAWREVQEAARPDQAVAVGRILRGLPLLPRDEDASPAALDLGHHHRRLMRRHCRKVDEWEAGATPAALIRRAELANLHAEAL